MIALDSRPIPVLLGIFVVAAALIWISGVKLSQSTDILDERLHLGSAFGGLIVLAVATNLPEIAITVSAAVSGNVEVAVGNILGGIGIQTVVLAFLDFFGKRGRSTKPLTYRAASLTLVLEALVVVAVLTVVVAGTQLPSSLVLLRATPAAVLIAVIWMLGLFLVQRAGKGLPWHEDGEAPGASAHPKGHRVRHQHTDSETHGSTGSSAGPPPATSTSRTVTLFVVSALVTLVAGVVLERSGEAASSQVGLSGVLYGATLLALATSLPEISTGLQAVRQGDDNLAMSDIFGGNAFLPVLFLVATLISGEAVLPSAGNSDIYLTALAALLTLVYVVGLIFRPARKVAGMGIDSAIVIVLYLVGIGGLIAIVG